MPEYDVIITNGTVVDGTGAPGKKLDVGIIKDRIKAMVSPGLLHDSSAALAIEAAGKTVCPGFIDTHSHCDLLVLKEPVVSPKSMQGITTEVIGQDGMSLAPLRDDLIPAWKKTMAGLEGDYDVNWDWRDVAGYLDKIDEMGPGPNFVFLAPQGNIRMAVMGLEDKPAAPEEMAKMQSLLGECLDQGAFGMSTGMVYPPCCYSSTEEFVELAKVLAKRDAVFVTHQRNESNDIITSMKEILTITERSGCRSHFSHFKVAGKENWGNLDGMFGLLDGARERGFAISVDQYPYTAGSTMLSVILPPWAHRGGSEKLLKRLADPHERAQMKKDIVGGIPGWDNFVRNSGLDGIYVTFVKTGKNADAVGKNLIELGEQRGRDPLDAAFDLLLEEENAVGLIHYYGLEEHIVRIMQRPEQNVCTDGIMGSKPHPRLYGSFPRVLRRFVREQKVLSLETAIHKMTGKPASVLGLKDRGTLKEGSFADIVIFDAGTVEDKATYAEPMQYPTGIDYVFVNGKAIMEKGKCTPRKAGKVLRFGE